MTFTALGIALLDIVKRWPSAFSVITLTAFILFAGWSLGAIGDDGFLRQAEFDEHIDKFDEIVTSMLATEQRQKRWYAARIADDIRAKVKLLCPESELKKASERNVLIDEIEALQEEYEDNRGRPYAVPPCSLL